MRIHTRTSILAFSLMALALPAFAQQPSQTQPQAQPQPPQGKPEDTEVWKPEPKVVSPGAGLGAAPSDAIVLFDGKNLDEWISTRDRGAAGWTVADGVVTVNKKAGNI